MEINIDSIRVLIADYTGFSQLTKFLFFSGGIVLLATIAILCCIHRRKAVSAMRLSIGWMRNYCMQTARQIKASKVKHLLLVSLLLYIYAAFTLPVTHDEALTYLHYLTCPVWNTMMYYTMPNNHVLFSLIEHVFILPPGDLLFKMRLPVVLISVLTLVFAYRFVRKYYGEKVALTLVAVMSMSGMFLFYSVLARGYCLVLLFFVLCLYAGFNIVNNNNRRRDWIAFALGGALGMYAVPTFLYAFVAINIYILIYNYKNIKQQFVYGVGMLVGCNFLYLPVLLGSGWQSLLKNPHVNPISSDKLFAKLPDFFAETIESLFAFPPYATLTVIVFSIAFCLVRKDWKIVLLWIIFCATPLLFVILQSVIPFSRTFVYCTVAIVFLVGVTFRENINKVPLKTLFPALLVIQILLFINFKQQLSLYLAPLATYENFAKEYLKSGRTHHIVGKEWSATGLYYIEPNLKFEAARTGDFEVTATFVKEIDADTISGYDYIFVQSDLDKTKTRRPTSIYLPDSIENYFLKSPIHIYRGKE